MQDAVYAIIVTYNPDIQLIKKQYISLINQVDGIIYIDNGSENFQSFFFFIKEYLSFNVLLIQNESNVGLGHAQNQGITKAIDNKATHIVLFDDDSLISDDFILKIREVEKKLIQQKKRIGLIGPAFINLLEDNPSLSPGYIFKGLKIEKRSLRESTLSVSYCIASGSFIPVTVFAEVGLINEKLFIDGLDVEWCCRAKSYGFEIFITPEVVMKHYLGEKATNKLKTHSSLREYYICRNSILLTRYKYIPLGYRIRKIIFIFFRIVTMLFHGYFSHFKMGLRGLVDAMKGKTGEFPIS